MTEYARSPAVYREVRTALGPWCGENGYRRHRGTDAGWIRALENGQDLSFRFRCNPWGSGATGSSFYGLIQTAPAESSGVIADASTIRQCDISLCLVQAELDALRQLQTLINRKRPRAPETEAWMREDSMVGAHTRDMYSGNEKPYREGDILTFAHYSLDDVRSHAEFLSRHLADIVVRFTQKQCARPTPVPPPPFFGRLGRVP